MERYNQNIFLIVMSIFSRRKKRGRPSKTSSFQKTITLLKISGISFLGISIVTIFFVLYSFSSFLFLSTKSFDLLGLGDNNKKTYLITLHNDGELRPTLGFLTGFIFLEIEGGDINMEFHDSYDIKAPEKNQKILAPDIIEERFSKDSRYQGWVFRDSNFSPLHAENAKNNLKFLQYDNRYKNKKIDAVISVDLYALGEIVDALGGVEFQDQTVTSKNLFSILETKAKTFDFHSEDEWLSRKNEIKPLANKIIKTLAFSPFHWKDFSDTIEKLGNEKHFLVYFKDAEIQNLFSKNPKKHWTGEFNQPENSFLIGHNIANLGGKKGDRYIQKDFSSIFSISSQGKISEKLSLRLQHHGTRNLNSDRYFAFVRIFRDKGTRLEKFSGNFVNTPIQINNSEKKALISNNSSDSNQYEEFQFFLQIDESSEENFSLEFSYPFKKISKNDTTQDFFIFSQAGKNSKTESHSLIFQGEGDTSFEFIKNKNEDQGICAQESFSENIAICKITSPGDKTLHLKTLPDTKKPILEESIILEEGRKLRLQFSPRF